MKPVSAIPLILLVVMGCVAAALLASGSGERVAYYGIDAIAEHARQPGSVQDALDRTHSSTQPRQKVGGTLVIASLVGVIALALILALMTPFITSLTGAMKVAKKGGQRPRLAPLPQADPPGFGTPLPQVRPFPLPDQQRGALPPPSDDEGVDWL